MSLRAVSRLLVVSLLSVGRCVALANTAGDVPTSLGAAIEKATYQIEPARKAGTNTTYVASNRARGMRFSFTSSGVLVSGASSSERWNLGMNLKSWGYGNKTRRVPRAKLAVSGDRIEYRRGPLAEWYSNSQAGLEQGFTVHAPPASGHRSGSLRLRLALSGDLTPSLAGEGGGLLLARAGGERVLRFAGLKAFDAAGRSLPSQMELRRTELALLVDDTAAVYPLTVDPLLSKETKLTASDPAPVDQFGQAVAVSGDTVVVGSQSGSGADVFVRSAGVWSHQQKLTASDGGKFVFSGGGVAVSGNTVVVSAVDDAPGPSAGSAYVFVRSGGNWSQQQKLTASDLAALDQFGSSVAVSGNTALIGAYGDDDAGTNAGAAYVFVRSGSAWSQQQKLTPGEGGVWFGWSAAISGHMAVVGSPFSGDAGSNSGSAYVFVRSGGVWSRQKLTASDAATGDVFGYSVAISADTAVVGSPGDSSSSGSAYVFARSGGVWSEQQKLTVDGLMTGDLFGWSVAVSGDTAVVGAHGGPRAGASSGSAYVFVRSGGVWSQQQKLTASDAAAGDRFGYSVAVSGAIAVIGAPNDSNAVFLSGAAYVYDPRRRSASD